MQGETGQTYDMTKIRCNTLNRCGWNDEKKLSSKGVFRVHRFMVRKCAKLFSYAYFVFFKFMSYKYFIIALFDSPFLCLLPAAFFSKNYMLREKQG